MADGFDIHIDRELARRIADQAKATGQSPEDLALTVLGEAFVDLDWAEDLRRAAEYDRTGVGHSVDEVFDGIEAEIRARVTKAD